ncbi:MAG: LacI family DNA-binding transcriptional regulator [Bacteroidales bacterium]
MTIIKARLKDIASLSGVSIGTVDRVLHERGEVAETTRIKVLKIARELNYTPNLMARVLKSKRPYNLVSLLPQSTVENTFWNKHPLGMARAMTELDPFPVSLTQINFDMLSEDDFVKNAKSVLKLNPDGVLLAPIFKSESTTFCSNLLRENIPFVFVDGYIPETGFLAYIGENVFQSGKVAGQLIDMITPKGKDILIINIARNLQNIHHLNNRTKGFLSYFPESGNRIGEKISLNISDSSVDTVKKELDKMFNNCTNISSIFVSGSKSFKIADYIESEGIKSVNLIGYDLLESNVAHLKSGTIKFLIGQRPEEQTYKGVKKLFDYLSLHKIPERIEYLPIDVVTSENVDFFI